MNRYSYFYLLTNFNKSVLYAGITCSFSQRLKQHVSGELEGFSKKYKCKYLVYYEKYENINDAIFREKQVKKWNRKKKAALINKSNPDWKSLNESVFRIDEEYL